MTILRLPIAAKCNGCGCCVRCCDFHGDVGRALAFHLESTIACCREYLDVVGEVFTLERRGGGPIPVILASLHVTRIHSTAWEVQGISIFGTRETFSRWKRWAEASEAIAAAVDTIRRYRREGAPCS